MTHFLSLFLTTVALGQTPTQDLSDFRTLDKAIVAKADAVSSSPKSLPGYLGINVKADDKGGLAVVQVHADSPAGKAGLQAGDVVNQVNGQTVRTADALRAFLQGKKPGETIAISVLREQKPLELKATLAATSRPLAPTTGGKGGAPVRGVIGVQIGDAKKGAGAQIDQVTPGMLAAKAGLKVGDVVTKIDDKFLTDGEHFRQILAARKPGDKVTLTIDRPGGAQEVPVTLASSESPGFKGDAGEVPIWKKNAYRLAVIVVDFPDVKHNEKITPDHWQEAFFRHKSYDKTATGQPAHGSLNDYFLEQSFGKFHIEGKAFDVIHAAKKRADYYQGAGGNKTALLSEVLDKLAARDGKDALKDFDGLCFVYAGSALVTNRGSLYFPHQGKVGFQDKRWPYIIAPEGGPKMETIGVFACELGKLLGLPDLSARPENPGSEGLGVWCLMSNGAGQKGRPSHLCAWCKEQLGWLEPVTIDPAVKQKLILSPVQTSARECVKVPIRSDGSEYLLLENRTAKGFDADLPGQGLLIWRVTNGRPLLEEAHGVVGPQGPRVFLDAVPYPSKSNHAFTPYTTPSSNSLTGGGVPVHITNIRRLADGRITFFAGYEYY